MCLKIALLGAKYGLTYKVCLAATAGIAFDSHFQILLQKNITPLIILTQNQNFTPLNSLFEEVLNRHVFSSMFLQNVQNPEV
jgi:hypothetical protein